MTAIFKTKNVYGKDLIYPVNETARQLTGLTRKQTVDSLDLLTIKTLGIEVIIDQFPVCADLQTIVSN
jgi:hypothetical protein